jgi:lipopolysaccharide export system permease protein
MGIFGRYVFRQAAGSLILIMLSLTGVVWIALALRQLNVVTAQGQDALTFLKMTTLALPNMMALIAPVALLVAVIHTLNRLSGDSELIVLTASGASVWMSARPLIVLALLVLSAVAGVNHYLMPWSLRELRDIVVQVRTNLISQVLMPGRFSSPEPNLTIHIRERSINGELFGLVMHDARDANHTITYLAEHGMLVKQNDQSFLVMDKGHVLRRPRAADAPQIVSFQTYAVDLERFEAKAGYVELRPRERFFRELAFPADGDLDFKRQPGQFRAELHERFANPLYCLAFVMIALAFIGHAQSTRQNRWTATAIAGVLAMSARMGGLAVNNLVVLDAKWVPLLYALPVGAILLSAFLISFGGGHWRGFGRRLPRSRGGLGSVGVQSAAARAR